jgi:hypothetical protein
MPMVRTPVLPPGFYWVNVIDSVAQSREQWDKFVERNRGTVHVRKTKQLGDGIGIGDWYLFEVTIPTAWIGPGFPNSATSETTDAVISTKPPPEAWQDYLPEVPSMGSVVAPLVIALGIGLGILFVVKGK